MCGRRTQRPRKTVRDCRSVTVHSCSFPRAELEPVLERLQPGIRNLHAAERGMRLTVLALAVPVRSPADAQRQAFRDAHEPLLDGGRVAGMPHFDAVETLILKDPE